MTARYAVARVAGALGVVALLVVLAAGCGSVGNVGSGASRAGVDPVRGTSAFSSSPYAAMDAKQQSERVNAVAKANEQTGKKTVALLNKTKALPDLAGPEVAEVKTDEQPTLDPQMKAVVAGLEAQPPASSSDRYASEAGVDYADR